MGMLLVVFMCLLWKWSKLLFVVVLMELLSAILMGSMFLFSSSLSEYLIMMFLFFVSEALVLLSSMYSSLRFMGIVNSGVILS